VIVVDASAVLAILLDEPEAAEFARRIAVAGGRMSPVSYWEVLARAYKEGRAAGVERAGALIDRLGIEVIAAGRSDAQAAHLAFTRFGKGNGGPLNLGDCFAYALAEVEGEGLLFKGDDFPRTDVKAVF
jgi:ribonuclease VapC